MSMHRPTHSRNGTRRQSHDIVLPKSLWNSKSIRFGARLAAIVLIGCIIAGINHACSGTPYGVRGQATLDKFDLLSSSRKHSQCRDVRFAHNQCAFVRQHCQDQDDGLISYLELYYCSLPHLKALAWVIILLWTALLFTSIGICAESFFSVNLSFIAKVLHLSDTFAGVTLLALGNGGPDLFSTWAAMSSDSPELAIGELIGAATFITTVIAGSIALLGPFYIRKVSFVRDASFLMLTAILLLPVLMTQRLYLWQGLVMIGIYVVYVACVVGHHWWTSSRAKTDEHVQTGRPEHERTPLLPDHSHDTLPPTPPPEHHSHHPHHSHHQRHLSIYKGNSVYKEMNGWRRHHGVCIQSKNDYRIQPSLIGALEYRRRRKIAQQQDANPPQTQDTTETTEHKEKFGARHMYMTLFPILQDFGNRRLWHTGINVCTAIPFLLMKITIPAVDVDEDGETRIEGQGPGSHGWDRWLLLLQSFLAPQFVWILLWPYMTESRDRNSWLHPALFCLAGSVVFALVVLVLTTPNKRPSWSPLLALIGFGLSAYWLCTIANEVVAILKAIGAILGVSEGILGFTLFAIGNSIDDYVADMTVSQHGHQVMALSACFGGPLLNILLGLGASTVYVVNRDAEATGHVKSILLSVDLPLLVSTAVLAAAMVVLIVVLWFRQWQMTRSTGIALVCTWIALATANVLVEVLVDE